jgi:hypothetical protein
MIATLLISSLPFDFFHAAAPVRNRHIFVFSIVTYIFSNEKLVMKPL